MVSLSNKYLRSFVQITADGEDIPSNENLENEEHNLSVKLDKDNGDVYLEFSSRLAMYDFARSLMHDALFNQSDTTELYPLKFEGQLQIVNGVRLKLDSSRVFVNYPCLVKR